jgi:uncharacterized protein YggE
MRRIVLVVLALAVMFSFVACNEKESRTINVTGHSEVTLRAEQAVIHLSVKLVRKDTAESHDALTNALESVTKDLTAIGLKDEDIKRSLIEQGPEYEWKDDTQVRVGYYSEANVEVHIDDIDLMPKAYRALAAHDDVSVSFTEFKRSDENEQRMEQYEKALKAARKKAEMMAKTLGARLGKVRNIVELEESGIFSVNAGINANFEDQRPSAGSSVSAPAEYGYVTVEGRVAVKFELE